MLLCRSKDRNKLLPECTCTEECGHPKTECAVRTCVVLFNLIKGDVASQPADDLHQGVRKPNLCAVNETISETLENGEEVMILRVENERSDCLLC